MKKVPIYRTIHKASAVAMIMALLWLTVSAPFVNAVLQDQVAQNEISAESMPSAPSSEEEAPSPLGNNTEEKSGNSTFSEEYLHGHDKADHFLSVATFRHMCDHADTYHAFHGELLVPPPNFS